MSLRPSILLPSLKAKTPCTIFHIHRIPRILPSLTATTNSFSHSERWNLQRWNSSTTAPTNTTTVDTDPPQPSYQLTFTCRPCQARSSHTITKQAYHKGTVLIQCPGCKNRHVITDHLKIFSEKSKTLEEILAEKGEKIKHGHIREVGGDVELYGFDSDSEGEGQLSTSGPDLGSEEVKDRNTGEPNIKPSE